jgi:hypothetical protein
MTLEHLTLLNTYTYYSFHTFHGGRNKNRGVFHYARTRYQLAGEEKLKEMLRKRQDGLKF